MAITASPTVDRTFDQGNATFMYGTRLLAGVLKLSWKWNAEAEHYFTTGRYGPDGVGRVMIKPDGEITMLFDDHVALDLYRNVQMSGALLGSPMNVSAPLQIYLNNGFAQHHVVLDGCKILGMAETDIEKGTTTKLEITSKLIFTGGSIDGAKIVIDPNSAIVT